MIEEAPNTNLPTRSRLYSLPILGQCGATQESLLDYVSRVSVAHNIAPRRMLCDVVFPALSASKNPRVRKGLGTGSYLPVNGVSSLAVEFVGAMERLTGQTGLARGTLLPWQGLLSQKTSISPVRRWCPLCLEAQGDPRHYAHSLLWTLSVVTSCPIHRIALAVKCQVCGSGQPVLGSAHVFARCAKCESSLKSTLHVASDMPTMKDRFIAEAMAELIASRREATSLADWNLLKARLLDLARDSFEGSIPKMAKKLNVANSLLYLRSGPSLSSLLEVSYRLGVRPLELLRGSASIEITAGKVVAEYRFLQHSKESDWHALEAKLAVEVRKLTSLQDKVVRLADLERKTGMRIQNIERKFPEVIKAFREHNQRSRVPVAAEKLRLKLAATKQAMQTLVLRGDPATTKCIQAALREHGIRWRTPETAAAARAELVRLGRVPFGRASARTAEVREAMAPALPRSSSAPTFAASALDPGQGRPTQSRPLAREASC